ncbi:phenylacetate--CoA ligase family protein [Oligosphaera ethanolica]|uniref:Phenylacetate-coenzyme A ligase n=1 Tax=Oligosphaera ethanolica TaxID=760260 RepID=A0AAE4AQY2_9BACT|nr:phenylacetate--CoA ligase [Oligosphaera ethanolica]MDQ0290862.1 phenylacetate-CoA ligase [Oligosphaera ethanolica]
MSSIYWQEDIETLPRPQLAELQLKKLRESITRALRSPFYGKLYRELNISAESIKTYDDVRKLPITTKDDLRACYPFELLTCPKDNIIRMHCTSGTTGNPAAVLYSRHDLDSWANLMARSMFATGARPADVFQNMSGYGLFTGGLGFQYGAERLGCLTIPAAAGNSRRQIKLMQDFGTTIAHSIPSYLGRLHAVFLENGLDPIRDTKLERLFIGAEPHSEETRLRIQEMFGAKAYNSFGMTEMNGPGVAFECSYQNGMHLWEDCYLLEIVNPDTLEPVPDGEIGEMILTTLDREAMPIIRYRTRDLTCIIPDECPCGRTSRRIDRIKGRSDDMFIIKGCNVFPIQIERVLMRIREIGSDYLIVLDRNDEGDTLTVQAELKSESFTDDYKQLDALRRRIANDLRDEILVTPAIQLVGPGELPKNEGKAVRVKDLRA